MAALILKKRVAGTRRRNHFRRGEGSTIESVPGGSTKT